MPEVAVGVAIANAEKECIDNTKLLEETGLRVVHIRPTPMNRTIRNGMTVAYRPVFRGARVVEISTSICSPRDTWTRKKGAKLAIEHFLAGRVCQLPLNPRHNVVETIIDLFRWA